MLDSSKLANEIYYAFKYMSEHDDIAFVYLNGNIICKSKVVDFYHKTTSFDCISYRISDYTVLEYGTFNERVLDLNMYYSSKTIKFLDGLSKNKKKIINKILNVNYKTEKDKVLAIFKILINYLNLSIMYSYKTNIGYLGGVYKVLKIEQIRTYKNIPNEYDVRFVDGRKRVPVNMVEVSKRIRDVNDKRLDYIKSVLDKQDTLYKVVYNNIVVDVFKFICEK